MGDRRSVIMDAKLAADAIHDRLDLKAKMKESPGRIDVFGILLEQAIPVIFRPLSGLLGAYLNEPARGVIISTTRPLITVQRFTAAHELGHVLLGHTTPSFDNEQVLARSPLLPTGYDAQELAANVFASHLLMPTWLLISHMKMQGWQASDIHDPQVIYQLSLRLGSSYAATCHALTRLKALSASENSRFLDIKVKSLKQRIAGPIQPESWHGDFWHLTPNDDGLTIEPGIRDTLVLDLPEHSSGGYLWQIDEISGSADLEIAEDWRESDQQGDIGCIVSRMLAFRPTNRGSSVIKLSERRPWLPEQSPINTLTVHCEVTGPMEEGLPEETRQLMLVDAA